MYPKVSQRHFVDMVSSKTTGHGSPVGRDRGEPLLQCVTSHNGGVLAPLLPL